MRAMFTQWCDLAQVKLEQNEREDKEMKTRRELAVEVEKLVHAVDPNFWVPAIGNGQLGELFSFIEKNNLWDAVKAATKETK